MHSCDTFCCQKVSHLRLKYQAWVCMPGSTYRVCVCVCVCVCVRERESEVLMMWSFLTHNFSGEKSVEQFCCLVFFGSRAEGFEGERQEREFLLSSIQGIRSPIPWGPLEVKPFSQLPLSSPVGGFFFFFFFSLLQIISFSSTFTTTYTMLKRPNVRAPWPEAPLLPTICRVVLWATAFSTKVIC